MAGSLFLSSAVFGQEDSLAVVQARWETTRIAPGIKFKHFSFDNHSLFHSNQNISILEIKNKRRNEFDLACEAREKRTTSEFGRESGALGAINGTFFDVKNGGSVDFIRSNGKIINENRLAKGERARHQKAALVIKTGQLHIAKWDGSSNWEQNLDGEDVMLSGPLLLYDNASAELDSGVFSTGRNPRTAVAHTKNNRILLITVDGRNVNAAGMSLSELRNLMKWLQAEDAINLDGGGSTTMWIRDEPGNGVVNYPSDNKKWDHQGERKVANAILVKRK